MQLIITDAWMAKTRAIDLGGVGVTVVLFLFSAFLMLTSVGIYHWLLLPNDSLHQLFGAPLAEDIGKQDLLKKDRFLRENLDVLARRVGELQAKIIELESLGNRVSGLAGIKSTSPKGPVGKGGALVMGHSLSMLELESTVSGLERLTSERNDFMSVIESRLLDKKMKSLMIPTGVPIEDGAIGSAFGWRVDPINGQSALHTGLDFQAVSGTPIIAAAGGIVVTQEYHAAYGNMVEIDHGNDVITRYAHAQKTMVKKGDLIRRGQILGEVGTTGRSTGPHLHFEVLVNGIAQDPQRFLDASNASITAQVGTLVGAKVAAEKFLTAPPKLN